MKPGRRVVLAESVLGSELFGDHMTDVQTMEWRDIEMLWGRKPADAP
jgi:hypothetical protein